MKSSIIEYKFEFFLNYIAWFNVYSKRYSFNRNYLELYDLEVLKLLKILILLMLEKFAILELIILKLK